MKNTPSDYENPYLKNQLIAYIGNKRRLLGFLEEVFSELAGRLHEEESGNPRVIRFGDCFAGSGSVSRLAKTMGFSVASNDWELYSNIINTAHISVSSGEEEALFADTGFPSVSSGLQGLFEELNNLPAPAPDERYISRYYAPETTEGADYRKERLFYTHENALFIDAVRSRIEQMFPGMPAGDDYKRKCILLAPLLYQAATHANTNGVFKAYHKGFGGHGGDALTRIMAPMQLQTPLTAPALPGRTYRVSGLDAAGFAAQHSGFDICYLDPPYNQHQYGSNYFMLNTIARWDRPEVSMNYGADGRLKVKAGIRSDWTETKSGFCYSRTAPQELRRLLDNINARYIVLSYNTEGIIPFDDLFEILADYGRVEIFCRDYVIYRGGKQSLGRANRNVEFQLVLTKGRAVNQQRNADRAEVERILRIRSIISVMNESFAPERLQSTFRCFGSGTARNSRICRLELVRSSASLPGGVTAAADSFYRFTEVPDTQNLSSLSGAEVEKLLSALEACRCVDRHEEADVLIGIIRTFKSFDTREETGAYRRYWKALLNVIRKFTYRKYRAVFEQMFEKLETLYAEEKASGKPGHWSVIDKKIEELQRVAGLRFNG